MNERDFKLILVAMTAGIFWAGRAGYTLLHESKRMAQWRKETLEWVRGTLGRGEVGYHQQMAQTVWEMFEGLGEED